MSATQATDNPFAPGPGDYPPCLAGRQEAQDLLSDRLDRLLDRKRPGSPILLYGPRGTGKSVLLEWFENQCHERGGVRVVASTADALLASEESVLNGIFPRSAVPKEYRLSLMARFFAALQGRGEVTLRAIDARWTHLAQTMSDESKRQPLVVLVDEAHDVVNWGAYKGFVGSVLEAQKKGSLVQLVLAGTPGLPNLFRTRVDGTQRGLTGMERAEHQGMGRLSFDAAGDAIRIPMEEGGHRITPEALEAVAEEAHRYPFFLQCWGHALWEVASAQGRDLIEPGDIPLARKAVDKRINEMYLKRYLELFASERDLLLAASAVAAEFRERQRPMNAMELVDVLQAALRETIPDEKESYRAAVNALDSLTLVDYIWRQPGDTTWEPGIPSFMDFILSQQSSRSRQAAPETAKA